jgi:hypothetical protein
MYAIGFSEVGVEATIHMHTTGGSDQYFRPEFSKTYNNRCYALHQHLLKQIVS